MFVITADQVGSRQHHDLVAQTLAAIAARGGALVAEPVRNAGDELQLATTDAALALEHVLGLTRDGLWSVGLGIGTAAADIPADLRAATGAVFYAARTAVDQAKRLDPAFALAIDPADSPDETQQADAAGLQSLLTLLLALRQRRTTEGWEVVDALQQGRTQRAIAAELGISPQAVNERVRTSLWRTEAPAHDALVRLMARLDHSLAADAAQGTQHDAPKEQRI